MRKKLDETSGKGKSGKDGKKLILLERRDRKIFGHKVKIFSTTQAAPQQWDTLGLLNFKWIPEREKMSLQKKALQENIIVIWSRLKGVMQIEKGGAYRLG